MNNAKMMELCNKFFDNLAETLKETHEVVESCNADCTRYLIPKGSIDKLTYYSKPANSYRVSDHWNWYANINKCINENYIQCLCSDLPRAKKRSAEGKPSSPIYGCLVAAIGSDGKYHHVFGEKFDRHSRTWSWEGEE